MAVWSLPPPRSPSSLSRRRSLSSPSLPGTSYREAADERVRLVVSPRIVAKRRFPGIGAESSGPRVVIRPLRAEHSYERSRRLDDVLEDGRRAQHPSRAGRAPGQVAVGADDRVEAGQILVEPEHVGDGRRQCVSRLHSDPSRDDIGTQLPARLGQPNRPRTPRHEQRRLERAFREVDVVRR